MSHVCLTCRVGTEWYGIDVASIVEVMYLVALNDVPAVSPHVLGLMTLRQTQIPVLDLRRRFGVLDAPLTLRTPMIAVHTTAGQGAFVVDETDLIVQLDMSQLEYLPRPGVRGTVRLNHQTIFLLDASQLLQEVVFK